MRARRPSAAAAVLAVALVAGCAAWMPGPPERPDRIVDSASGRELARAELVAEARAADFVLLGELHDNPAHHALRGELIAALGAGTVVAAEQLPSGPPPALGGDLQRALVDAGFDARGWGWPLHEPLFAAVRRAGATLVGANVPRELARRIAREGDSQVPAAQRALLDAAPLAPAARATLEADLVEGHCGQLAGERLQRMVWAQRTRDVTMAQALVDAAARPGTPRPVVLVAGNGHVRAAYGVPQLLAHLRPGARVLAVGLFEHGRGADEEHGRSEYTHLWFTRATTRDDPCASMPRPPAGASG